jgi:hypothetical protein
MEISGFIWAEIQVFNRLPKVINNCQKRGVISFTFLCAKLFLLTRKNNFKHIVTKTVNNHGFKTGRHL